MGAARVASERVPAATVQKNVKGPVPPELPLKPTVPPELTT